MRAEQLMTKQVKSCSSDDTLERAAQLMWDGDCGCLPVCATDGITRVVGVITDRDICMSTLFEGKPLRDLRVADTMAKLVLACKPSDSLADVGKTMRDAQIRRLPVVDERGALVGIIALADLAREAAREHTSGKGDIDITETDVGDTLAAICRSGWQRLAA